MAENNGYTNKELLELLRGDFNDLRGEFKDFQKEVRKKLEDNTKALSNNFVTKGHLESELQHIKDRYDPVRTGMIYVIGLMVTAIIGTWLYNIGLK